MPGNTEYRGFNILYDESVNVLITPIKIIPILTTDTAFSNVQFETMALWDTGATVTCIKPALWDRLKMYSFNAADNFEISGVGGKIKTSYTLANLFLENSLEIEHCPIFMLDFPGNADILIGMDIIGMGDFAICNTEKKTSFSFIIPPLPERINFVEKLMK